MISPATSSSKKASTRSKTYRAYKVSKKLHCNQLILLWCHIRLQSKKLWLKPKNSMIKNPVKMCKVRVRAFWQTKEKATSSMICHCSNQVHLFKQTSNARQASDLNRPKLWKTNNIQETICWVRARLHLGLLLCIKQVIQTSRTVISQTRARRECKALTYWAKNLAA